MKPYFVSCRCLYDYRSRDNEDHLHQSSIKTIGVVTGYLLKVFFCENPCGSFAVCQRGRLFDRERVKKL
jgi:hypothetical protein